MINFVRGDYELKRVIISAKTTLQPNDDYRVRSYKNFAVSIPYTDWENITYDQVNTYMLNIVETLKKGNIPPQV